MRRFEGKVVLATGAASGMGRAACVRFASEGAAVFGLDVDAEGLAETERIVSEAGGKIRAGRFDVTRRDSCAAGVEAAVSAFGRLDVLLNVAGVVRFSHSAETPEDEWNLVLAVNLSGPFFMFQAALPHLLESRGNVVNVGSNAALMGQAYTAAYCASKAGLVNLTRALAMEYMKSPIRVNAVCPGGTKTNMNVGIQFPEDVDWKLIKRYMNVRDMSEPEDVAAALAFVASDEARSVHGSVFSVDNGMMAG